uniref:Prolyl 4-hydroxylase subunit alpha 3 n=1 Tax=Varanus komodoensis TaxID=61221 RepID=A0A8D2IWL9_VARKO
MANPEGGNEAGALKRPSVTHLQTRDTYEALCQTLGCQPTRYQLLHLSCSYETNRDPFLILQPLKREIMHRQPYIALYHDFISDAEAEQLKGLAAPWVSRPPTLHSPHTYCQGLTGSCICFSAWLKDTLDPVIVALDRRIVALTGLNTQPPYAEYLQVVNYGLGGHYEPHFDHATSRKSPLYKLKSGNRIATLMIYVSTFFSFPISGWFSFQNAALFWWNLHKNGDGDEDTLHAGCPVLAGDKWAPPHRPCCLGQRKGQGNTQVEPQAQRALAIGPAGHGPLAGADRAGPFP